MKKRTPIEQSQHDLREKLIAYYNRRKPSGGQVQVEMASEVPCSISTMSALLQRQRPCKGMTAIAIERYLERVEG